MLCLYFCVASNRWLLSTDPVANALLCIRGCLDSSSRAPRWDGRPVRESITRQCLGGSWAGHAVVVPICFSGSVFVYESATVGLHNTACFAIGTNLCCCMDGGSFCAGVPLLPFFSRPVQALSLPLMLFCFPCVFQPLVHTVPIAMAWKIHGVWFRWTHLSIGSLPSVVHPFVWYIFVYVGRRTLRHKQHGVDQPCSLGRIRWSCCCNHGVGSYVSTPHGARRHVRRFVVWRDHRGCNHERNDAARRQLRDPCKFPRNKREQWRGTSVWNEKRDRERMEEDVPPALATNEETVVTMEHNADERGRTLTFARWTKPFVWNRMNSGRRESKPQGITNSTESIPIRDCH